MVGAGQELVGFLQRAAYEIDEGDNGAADEEGKAPGAAGDLAGRKIRLQKIAEAGGEDDGDLLAGRLPTDIETLVPRRRHFGKVDGDAAKLDAGGKPLNEPAGDDQDLRGHADGRVAGREGQQDGPDSHQSNRCDEAAAAPDAVDIRAENDGAERAHQKADAEGQERVHQRPISGGAGEKRRADLVGVKAEQKEVEHF